jgi:hypothetical protein
MQPVRPVRIILTHLTVLMKLVKSTNCEALYFAVFPFSSVPIITTTAKGINSSGKSYMLPLYFTT